MFVWYFGHCETDKQRAVRKPTTNNFYMLWVFFCSLVVEWIEQGVCSCEACRILVMAYVKNFPGREVSDMSGTEGKSQWGEIFQFFFVQTATLCVSANSQHEHCYTKWIAVVRFNASSVLLCGCEASGCTTYSVVIAVVAIIVLLGDLDSVSPAVR